MLPSVAAEPPPGWIATEIAQPVLGTGSGATVTQWSALRAPAGGGVLLLGCVATPIPGWVEDMRPSVEARTTALASAATERIGVGVARTFVGWSSTNEVMTCFATCASTIPLETQRGPRECDASVNGARLEGSSAPPAPGLALGTVTWAVHHPASTVLWAGLLTFFVGAVAVVTRRRPRSRI